MKVIDELVALQEEKRAFHEKLDQKVDCWVDQADVGPYELPCFVLISVTLFTIWVSSVKIFVVDLQAISNYNAIVVPLSFIRF